jgi:glycosyltransferase involved in cell wall biosynthesis
MASMVDGTRVTVVPTGVDVSTYGALAATAEEPRLLFLGSMDWEANVDAVDYFCRDIWPAILAAVPSARFSIVGRNPHPRVQRLASDTVTVTGAVPSVIEYLREAALLVVPHRVGGGTRLKIFEAMAAGKPVVSTSVGAEGLDVHDGRDILLADTPNQFADAVVGLLRDREWRRRVGEAARELAARYDWSVIAQQFEETVRKVALANQNGDTAPRNAPACIEHVPDLR